MKALELDAAKLARMKELQFGRELPPKIKEKIKDATNELPQKVKGREQSGDRVGALEDRVKAMEADLKKLIAELERQRRIK